MSESFIYLDNNATTPLLPEIVDAMHGIMVLPYGNPSSPHSVGEVQGVKLMMNKLKVFYFRDA